MGRIGSSGPVARITWIASSWRVGIQNAEGSQEMLRIVSRPIASNCGGYLRSGPSPPAIRDCDSQDWYTIRAGLNRIPLVLEDRESSEPWLPDRPSFREPTVVQDSRAAIAPGLSRNFGSGTGTEYDFASANCESVEFEAEVSGNIVTGLDATAGRPKADWLSVGTA